MVMVEYLYGTAPARVVYRMYRRRKECRVSFEEFIELFQSVPKEENICVLDGDRISLRGLLEEKEIYHMLLEYLMVDTDITGKSAGGYSALPANLGSGEVGGSV